METYFEYAVSVQELDETGMTQRYKTVEYCGIVCATSYQDAITKVLDYYGEEDLLDIKLSEWDCGHAVLQISKQALAELREDDGFDKEATINER